MAALGPPPAPSGTVGPGDGGFDAAPQLVARPRSFGCEQRVEAGDDGGQRPQLAGDDGIVAGGTSHEVSLVVVEGTERVGSEEVWIRHTASIPASVRRFLRFSKPARIRLFTVPSGWRILLATSR